MDARSDPQMLDELRERRDRLAHAVREPGSPPELSRLLGEVDAALDRIRGGTYGICEVCHDPIEDDRLRVDPLIRYCVDHLDARERDALQRDLDLATSVQTALLPRRDFRTDGWETHYVFRPAGAVSGDYLDVVPAGAGGFWFAVGDVSGKGIAASLLSAHLNALLRTLAPSAGSVGEMIDRANRVFCEGTLETHYATLVVGRAMPGGGVELSNAGHACPLLLRGGQPTSVPLKGLPLGMFCSGAFPVSRFVMAPGDALVLATDGLTEARNADGVEFGEDGLSKALASAGRVLTAEDLSGALISRATAHAAGTPFHDDVTLFVLRRSDAA